MVLPEYPKKSNGSLLSYSDPMIEESTKGNNHSEIA